jgi:hypothetical protein
VEFKKSFPETNLEDRDRAEALTWALLEGPLVLYALNLNGSVIIELHGILERFTSRDMINQLVSPSKRAAASKVLERCNLRDSAAVLQEIGIFDEKDIKFTDKLTALRNSIAHKNPRGSIKRVTCWKEDFVLGHRFRHKQA